MIDLIIFRNIFFTTIYAFIVNKINTNADCKKNTENNTIIIEVQSRVIAITKLDKTIKTVKKIFCNKSKHFI